MIRLCKNLFYKPKYSSDADSLILKKLCSTVTVVLVCLAAISFSAYAFFSYSVTSGSNTIKSSSFSSTVTIKKGDGVITHGEIQSYHFESPGQYTVTITANSATTGTGYCVVTINDVQYYTQQLGKDLNAPGGLRNEISFGLDVQTSATVSFISRWGTTSYYTSAVETELYIKSTDPLTVITVNGIQNSSDVPQETNPQNTDPQETTAPTIPEDTTAPAESAEVKHIVAEGESLSQIADNYGTTYQRIAAYNGIENPRLIQTGQEILIPPADWVETTNPTEVTE